MTPGQIWRAILLLLFFQPEAKIGLEGAPRVKILKLININVFMKEKWLHLMNLWVYSRSYYITNHY